MSGKQNHKSSTHLLHWTSISVLEWDIPAIEGALIREGHISHGSQRLVDIPSWCYIEQTWQVGVQCRSHSPQLSTYLCVMQPVLSHS